MKNQENIAPTSEIVGGYHIIECVVVRDLIFKLGHNPDAVQPYATWRCNKDDPTNNYWGYYWSDKKTAQKDLIQRAEAGRTDTPYDHTILAREQTSLADRITNAKATAESAKKESGKISLGVMEL